MTDEAKALVERLRTKYCCSDWDKGCNCEASADLIETQAREIERLREALRDIIAHSQKHIDDTDAYVMSQYKIEAASAALAGDSHE